MKDNFFVLEVDNSYLEEIPTPIGTHMHRHRVLVVFFRRFGEDFNSISDRMKNVIIGDAMLAG